MLKIPARICDGNADQKKRDKSDVHWLSHNPRREQHAGPLANATGNYGPVVMVVQEAAGCLFRDEHRLMNMEFSQ